MITVHDTFVCKPGNASKMAKMFKENMGKWPSFVQVMTDMTGQYHRVIMVSKYDSLAAYETDMSSMQNPSEEQKAAMKNMEGMGEMYVSGSREIFKIW